VSVAPEQDAPQLPAEADRGFRDAVTFAFGDPVAKLYGHARIGLGADGASGLALLFSGTEIAAAATASGVEVSSGSGSGSASWEEVRVAGLRTAVVQALSSWTLAFERDGAGFDLHFEARSTPALLDPESELAKLGGMQGYEQLCAVSGTVVLDGHERRVDCLGQRGHSWGSPDWKRIELARTLSAWLGADRALMLAAVRPARAKGHGEETVAAWLVDGAQPVAIGEPRLSTTYDAAQRQQRAGLELWFDEESEFARRASGKVLCGTTLDLGDVVLNSAFFGWRMEGREGVGRYDVMRRAGGKRGK
jgi:hypothetical protein